MALSSTQQLLNLNLVPEYTFANFFSDAPVLLALLKNIAANQYHEPQVVLWGSAASGKTHLLQATCQMALNSQQRAIYLPLAECLQHDPSCLEDLHTMDIVCLDDLHLIAQQPIWERAVFDLINQLRAQHTCLVIASQKMPNENLFQLADLTSRSVWGPVYKLESLDEENLMRAIHLQAHTRGLVLSEELVVYMLTHYPRDMKNLVTILKQLSQASLREQRKITIPLLKQVCPL